MSDLNMYLMIGVVVIFAVLYSLKLYIKHKTGKEDETLNRIISILQGILFNVENTSQNVTGNEKFDRAVSLAKTIIPEKDKTVIKKKFGGLEFAVEKIFQDVVQPLLLRKIGIGK